MQDASSEEMIKLQHMLSHSLETGKALLFTDTIGQIWEIQPWNDLNIDELPVETEDDLNTYEIH